MANRRKRLQRQADRKREQEQLDALATSLVEEGVPRYALSQPPSYIKALSFCVTSHVSGFEKDINFRAQLEWIKLRHREREFERQFFATRPTAVEDGGIRQMVTEYPHPLSIDSLSIGNCDFMPDPVSRIDVSKNGVPYSGRIVPTGTVDHSEPTPSSDIDFLMVPPTEYGPMDPIDRMLMESLNEPDITDSDAGDDGEPSGRDS